MDRLPLKDNTNSTVSEYKGLLENSEVITTLVAIGYLWSSFIATDKRLGHCITISSFGSLWQTLFVFQLGGEKISCKTLCQKVARTSVVSEASLYRPNLRVVFTEYIRCMDTPNFGEYYSSLVGVSEGGTIATGNPDVWSPVLVKNGPFLLMSH